MIQLPMSESIHRIVHSDARDLSFLGDGSINLVLTSPPYPMISMWDSQFSALDSVIARALQENRSREAFDRMHRSILLPVWQEMWRVLADGGIACVNIGDAVRTVDGHFQMYPNGPRILSDLYEIGFDILPQILWRKTTNAPTKFMGSGMLPAGAYVTLEHEHILIVRKHGRRQFVTDEQRVARRRSAIFWEERNIWFSDVWDLRGSAQTLKNQQTLAETSIENSPENPSQISSIPGGDAKILARDRSAAFPLDLAERLILMYSIRGDTVLDPFGGTLTTSAAALANARHSVSIEIEPELLRIGIERISTIVPELNRRVAARLAKHQAWAADYLSRKPGGLRHRNELYNSPVMTLQETILELHWIAALSGSDAPQGGKEVRAEHQVYRI